MRMKYLMILNLVVTFVDVLVVLVMNCDDFKEIGMTINCMIFYRNGKRRWPYTAVTFLHKDLQLSLI